MAVIRIQNGNSGKALFSLVLLPALGAVLAFGRSEWATSQSPDADERQRVINRTAITYAYLAVVVAVVTGWLATELPDDRVGPFTLIGAVGGGVHALSVALLSRRR